MFAFWIYFLFFVSVHFFNKYTVAAADALQIFGTEKRGEVENFDIKKNRAKMKWNIKFSGRFDLHFVMINQWKIITYELLEDRQYKSKR